MYSSSCTMFRLASHSVKRPFLHLQVTRAMTAAVKSPECADGHDHGSNNRTSARPSQSKNGISGRADLVRGFQGGQHQFSSDRAREILAANAECGQLSGHQHRPDQVHHGIHNDTSHMQHAGRDDHVDKYDSHGSVSLYSVMQSNVPEPFNPHGRNPTHLNMPGGGVKLGDKYLADKRVAAAEIKRKYSTSATESTSNDLISDMASPQGVQGSDCSNYKLWLENCLKYGFVSCVDQLQGVQSGRKSLQQVFVEQEALIHQIALSYQQKDVAMQGVQGDGTVNKYETAYQTDVQGVQGDIPNISLQELSELSHPCPQGVQGDDCVSFKLWLQNCVKFGFGDCEEQLKDLKSGRRTLQDVFQEQETLIREAVLQYSASAPSGKGPTQPGTNPEVSGTPGDPPVKLSQKERLKRAVKEYGATVVVFHIGISLVSLGGFYLAVSSGIDMVTLLSKIGVGQSILESKAVTGASTFVVAYAVHKVFAPVRIGITLTSTPFIVRYLRSIGFLKPPKIKNLSK